MFLTGLNTIENAYLIKPYIGIGLYPFPHTSIDIGSEISPFENVFANNLRNSNGVVLLNDVDTIHPLTISKDKGVATLHLEYDDTLQLVGNKLHVNFPTLAPIDEETGEVIQYQFVSPLLNQTNENVQQISLMFDDTLQLVNDRLHARQLIFEHPLWSSKNVEGDTQVFIDTNDSLHIDINANLGVRVMGPLYIKSGTQGIDEDGSFGLGLETDGKTLKIEDGKLQVVENFLKSRGAIDIIGNSPIDPDDIPFLNDLIPDGGDLPEFMDQLIDSKYITLKTDGNDFSQKTGTLRIKSQGWNRIPYYGLTYGFNSSGSFTYNETLGELHVDSAKVSQFVSPLMSNDTVVWKGYLSNFYQGSFTSCIKVGPEYLNKREIGLEHDFTLRTLPGGILSSNLIFAKTGGLSLQGNVVSVDITCPDPDLTYSPVGGTLTCNITTDEVTLMKVGPLIKGNYIGGNDIAITGNVINSTLVSDELTILKVGNVIRGNYIGDGINVRVMGNVITGVPLMITGGPGIIVTGTSATGYIISATPTNFTKTEETLDEEIIEDQVYRTEEDDQTTKKVVKRKGKGKNVKPNWNWLFPPVFPPPPPPPSFIPGITFPLPPPVITLTRDDDYVDITGFDPVPTDETDENGFPIFDPIPQNILTRIDENGCIRMLQDKPKCWLGIENEDPRQVLSLDMLAEFQRNINIPATVDLVTGLLPNFDTFCKTADVSGIVLPIIESNKQDLAPYVKTSDLGDLAILDTIDMSSPQFTILNPAKARLDLQLSWMSVAQTVPWDVITDKPNLDDYVQTVDLPDFQNMNISSLTLSDTTDSTSVTSGVLQVAGGAAIQKTFYAGGRCMFAVTAREFTNPLGTCMWVGGNTYTYSGTATTISNLCGTYFAGQSINTLTPGKSVTSASTVYILGPPSFTSGIGYTNTYALNVAAGDVRIGSTTQGAQTTGALIVSGGVSIGKNTFIGGGLVLTQTIDSTSFTNGSLQVKGGVGISMSTFMGGSLTVSASFPSTSPLTGAVKIAGGVGIAKSLYVGESVIVTGTVTASNLGSLSALNTLDYTSANLVNKPTLGSLSGLSSIDFNSSNFTVSSPALARIALQLSWLSVAETVPYDKITDAPDLSLFALTSSLGPLASKSSLDFNDDTSFSIVDIVAARNKLGLGSLSIKSTVDYSELTGTPDLSTYAKSTSLGSLSTMSTLDLNDSEFTITDTTLARTKLGLGSFATKSSLAYSELTDRPTLGTLSSLNTISYSSTYITGLPNLAQYATTSYVDNKTSFSSLTVSSTASIFRLTGYNTVSSPNDLLYLGNPDYNFFLDQQGTTSQIVLGYNTGKPLNEVGRLQVYNNITDRTLLFSVITRGSTTGSNWVKTWCPFTTNGNTLSCGAVTCTTINTGSSSITSGSLFPTNITASGAIVGASVSSNGSLTAAAQVNAQRYTMKDPNLQCGLNTEVNSYSPLLNFDVNLKWTTGLNTTYGGANFRIDSRSYTVFGNLFQWNTRAPGSTVEVMALYSDLNGNFTCQSLSQRSDVRLKTNIKPLENSLSNILKLQGCRYSWKNDAAHNKCLGLVAQDVEQIIPEIVRTNRADDMKSIDYSALVSVLVEAIKELNLRIDTLEKKIYS